MYGGEGLCWGEEGATWGGVCVQALERPHDNKGNLVSISEARLCEACSTLGL